MPTAKPTAKPVTPAPTSKPTAKPVTPAPTTKPTEKPTEKPVTPAPTSKPTAKPVTPAPTTKPTPFPTAKPVTVSPTTKPTDGTAKPTQKPVYTAHPTDSYSKGMGGHGEGKGKDFSKGKYEREGKGNGKGKGESKGFGKGKGSSEESSCLDNVYAAVQLWNGIVVEPNGDIKDISDATAQMGQLVSFVGGVYDQPEGYEVGYNIEECIRVDDRNFWHCQGTYINLYGCEGHLAFSGFYQDATMEGHMVITGGTGDFLGATGAIYEHFDANSGYTYRRIILE
ncbi:hypothetical protein ACA910_016587 [Epithemia clementina (nom. ined.)]